MHRHVDRDTPKFICETLAGSHGALPHGQELLDRAKRSVETGKSLLRLVSNSDIYSHPEFLEEPTVSPNHRGWWVLHDYSVDGANMSSYDIIFGTARGARLPFVLSELAKISTHELIVNYSQAGRKGEPSIEREIAAADRILVRGDVHKTLGKSVIKNSLGISYGITRTQQELRNSLSTIVEPLMITGNDHDNTLETYYLNLSQKYDGSLPSDEDIQLIDGIIIPGIRDILVANGIKVAR
jgi:hypothetical protein